MPVKIRLQRKGRTHYSVFSIVAADSRAPRDGRFIEKLGTYNPNTNPATIELSFDRALYWLQQGAQPSETAKAILSYKGVLYMKHLLNGVKKGAFDESEADRRFQVWLKDKQSAIQAKKDKLKNDEKSLKDKKLKDEEKVNEKKAKAIQEKLAAQSKKSEEEVQEEVVEETKKEEVVEETKVEEIVEETKNEGIVEEKKSEEIVEDKNEEVKE